MKKTILQLLAVASCVWAISAHAAKITLNPPPEVPTNLNAREFKEFTAKRNDLLTQLGTARGKIDSQARDCQEVEEDSPKVEVCRAKANEVKIAVKDYRVALGRFKRILVINSMNALAKRLGWSADEQARLAKALNSLAADGDPNVTGTQVRRAWQDIFARGQDEELAKIAAQGQGSGFPGAGTQSFEDCTIFALANAAGLPYGVVAARATKLIGEGEWGNAAERANPQQSIEQQGLMGGEVVMLTEAFGQVEVVPSADFAKTLKQGRPVMVNVVPPNGNFDNGHQVVLTKTFQHGGETWYEMMDSNQGSQQRRYVSAKELDTIQKEKGVTYRPEPKSTPMLLR